MNRAIQFCEKLKLTDDYLGEPLRLLPFQKDILTKLFTVGDDGELVYHKAFIFMPRKQAKTTLTAALVLFLLLGNGKIGQRIYSVAATRDQAALVFDTCKSMIDQDPWLKKRCKCLPSKKLIQVKKSNNSYQALSSDAEGSFGKRPSVIIWDELHCQKNRNLWNAMNSAFGATKSKNRLVVMLSTAGEDRAGLCREQFDYAREVQTGIRDDPEYLPILSHADPTDDWKDRATWYKAMPALQKPDDPNSGFCQLDFIEKEFALALINPAAEYVFKTYYLNLWLGSAEHWIPLEKWTNCKHDFDITQHYGKIAYGGLDCSVTTDFNSFVLIIPEDGHYLVYPMFWIPLEASTQRQNKDPALWKGWEQRGLVKIHQGDYIDKSLVADDIHKLCQNFEVKQIACDRAYAHDAAKKLIEYGYNLEWFNQSPYSMAGPTMDLQTDILAGNIWHNNHPCLNWMFTNCRVSIDDSGNSRLSKGRSADKIDGMISLLMAHAIAKAGKRQFKSVYETRGAIVI